MSENGAEGPEAARVRERHVTVIPALIHPGWDARMPWLVQGTTTRELEGRAFDLGLYAGASPESRVRANWTKLLAATGMDRVVHAPQVHGADVRFHGSTRQNSGPPEPCDGHVTVQPGVLLAVTVADCVPVFVAAPGRRAVAVLHAGWRGAAAGVLERGLSVLARDLGVASSDVEVHLGPSICRRCYQVGPEVFAALGQKVPDGPRPIDLRGVLAARAVRAGVAASAISISEHCTRCTGSHLFSHRGGDAERQVGYVGIRA